MIPKLTLATTQGSISPYILEGGCRDLLQLTQPQPPTSTDWAEYDGNDIATTPQELIPQIARPLTLKIFTSEDPTALISRDCQVTLERLGTFRARLHTCSSSQYPQGRAYTLKGELIQDPTQLPPDRSGTLQLKGLEEQYILEGQQLPFAQIGVTPLVGWEEALTQQQSWKTTQRIEPRRRATREVTLPVLVRGRNLDQLFRSRAILDKLLNSSPQTITTPYGSFSFVFVRSRVKDYFFAHTTSYIIYDLVVATI